MLRRDILRRADAQPQPIRSTLGAVLEPAFLLILLGMQVRQDENAGIQRHARQCRPDTDKDDHAN